MKTTSLSSRGANAGRALTGALSILALVAAVAPVSGDNGPTASAPAEAPSMGPEQMAVMLFNQAQRRRDKAWKLEEGLDQMPAAKRSKAETKIQTLYSQASDKLLGAIQHNPSFFQAYGDLGYSLRRQGRHREALAAYDRALELQPNYPEAMEYRAEAYLGLNRVEEAAQAHIKLRNLSPEHAAQLLDAFGNWVAARRDDPAGVDEALIQEVAQWVKLQQAVAATTGASSGGSAWH